MEIAHSVDVTFTNHFTPSNHLPRGCVHDTINDLYLYNHYAVNGRECSDELVCHCKQLSPSPTSSPTYPLNEVCNYLNEIKLNEECRIGDRSENECKSLATALGLFPNQGIVQTYQVSSSSYFSTGCIHYIDPQGQRFMKYNNNPTTLNSDLTNIPNNNICYIDDAFTSENNYTHSGCACACPEEIEQVYSLETSGKCPLYYNNRTICETIAISLGYNFDEEFTPATLFPKGCVFDRPNRVMVYNHWSVETDVDCSYDLTCYCDAMTQAPTGTPTTVLAGIGLASFTEAPTLSPTSTVMIPYYENTGRDAEFKNLTIKYENLEVYPRAGISIYKNQTILGTADGQLIHYGLNNYVIEPLGGIILQTNYTNLSPHLVDFNSSGLLELFVGTREGIVLTYIFDNNLGQFIRYRGPWDHIRVGRDVVPACYDLDHDGDFDCVLGEENGNINLFENVGDQRVPIFVQKHGETDNFFHHIDVGDNSFPSFLDANNDGLIDLIVGSKAGSIRLYINDGSATRPHFTASDVEFLIDGDQDDEFIGYFTKPIVVDANLDGLDDFVVLYDNEDPDEVIHDAEEFTYIGAFGVGSLFVLSFAIFSCRNSKKSAPLVTAEYNDDFDEEEVEFIQPVQNTRPGRLKMKSLRTVF